MIGGGRHSMSLCTPRRFQSLLKVPRSCIDCAYIYIYTQVRMRKQMFRRFFIYAYSIIYIYAYTYVHIHMYIRASKGLPENITLGPMYTPCSSM